jgi:hypothetical protein
MCGACLCVLSALFVGVRSCLECGRIAGTGPLTFSCRRGGPDLVQLCRQVGIQRGAPVHTGRAGKCKGTHPAAYTCTGCGAALLPASRCVAHNHTALLSCRLRLSGLGWGGVFLQHSLEAIRVLAICSRHCAALQTSLLGEPPCAALGLGAVTMPALTIVRAVW